MEADRSEGKQEANQSDVIDRTKHTDQPANLKQYNVYYDVGYAWHELLWMVVLKSGS